MNNLDLKRLEILARKYDETNIPLYLSYPVQGFWKSDFQHHIFDEMNSDKTCNDTYLYLHFPYCKSCCYYCNCNKYATENEAEIDMYIEYLQKEIELKRNMIGIRGNAKIIKMHWGGGTPTYMNVCQLERLFKVITQNCSDDLSNASSVAIEAYPDEATVTLEKLRLLRALGFNEISFGIQDFDSRVQNAINRNCNKYTARKLIETSAELGFEVHIDLCYGLPFQGLNEFERTLKDIISMNPDRIVIYPYTHYPMLFKMQKMIPSASVPNSFIKVLLAQMAEELLGTAGYEKVGYDTFVKPGSRMSVNKNKGKLIRDFMGTSIDEGKRTIGFGSSAVSYVESVYYENVCDIKQYFKAIDSGTIPIDMNKTHMLSYDDQIRSYIVRKNVLCDFVINKSDINNKFSISFNEYFEDEIKKLAVLERDGLIDGVNSDIITFTEDGILFARHVAYVFDAYYNKAGNK